MKKNKGIDIFSSKCIKKMMMNMYLSLSDLDDGAFEFVFKLIELFEWYRTHVFTSVASHA